MTAEKKGIGLIALVLLPSSILIGFEIMGVPASQNAIELLPVTRFQASHGMGIVLAVWSAAMVFKLGGPTA